MEKRDIIDAELTFYLDAALSPARTIRKYANEKSSCLFRLLVP